MSFFVAGILRIIMLEASMALVVIARLVNPDDRRNQRRLDIAFRTLAVIALFSWTNYGALRGGGNLVHRWEQYHFFFGSKYLPEVNYFDLYKATILADRELGGHVTDSVRITRDLATFDEESVAQALPDAERARIRANFSDARWRDFVADWSTLSHGNANWAQVLDDHGNSGSPAWALFAAPIARLVGIGPTGQILMGLIDPILMLVLFIACFYTFGTRPTCTMLIIWSMVPFSFDYLAGSLLRWDWLFALGMALIFWRRDKPLTAGAFLGYAIASKLFPLFFGVGFAFSAGWRMWQTRKLDRRVVRFVAGVVAAGIAAVLASMIMFGGLAVWKSYERRIATAQTEKFYSNQYSFRTTFLQFAHSSPREMARGWMEPNEIKQGRRDVDIANHKATFFLWQLALTALVAVAVSRGRELEGFAVGPLLVYVWLVVNAYYWNMLALPALAWSLRENDGTRGRLAPLLGLHVILIWFYVYQHLNHGFAEGYFVGLLMLTLLLVYFVTALRTPSTNHE